MTVETTLTACLQAALPDVPVRPDVPNAGDVAPYVIYQQFAAARPATLQGDCGLFNPRFQIDVYAPTKEQALAMKDTVRNAIQADAGLRAVFLNDISAFEPETSLYRHRQSFSFWINE